MIATLRRWWASERRAFVLDVLLAWAIGLISLFVADRVADTENETVAIGAVALLIIQSVALTFRRRRPMVVYSVVGFGTVAYAWPGFPASVSGIGVLVATTWPSGTAWGFAAPISRCWASSSRRSPRPT